MMQHASSVTMHAVIVVIQKKVRLIICHMCIMKRLLFPYHKDLWVFSFWFWFLFYHLCLGHRSLSSKSFLVIAILISYYIGMYSLSLPHIPTNTLQLLIDLWQTTLFSFMVFYFICVLIVSWLLCFLMACVFILLIALYFLWLDSNPCFFIYMIFLFFLLINHI